MSDFISCTLKQLPQDQWVDAAKIAMDINPANRPALHQIAQFASMALISGPIQPQHISALVTKYWKSGGVHLGVTFMDTPQADLRAKILSYMNLWNARGANVKFSESSQGEVRLSRSEQGYWSYLGTDILSIPSGQPTLNLEGFTMQTPESEFNRVVTHEAGHTCGFPHEHMRAEIIARIDPEKCIAYFLQNQGWSAQETVQQVLTPLNESQLIHTPHADQTSDMTYSLPGSITIDGQPITGGSGIDELDYDFVGKLYPGTAAPPPTPPPTPTSGKRKIVLKFPNDVDKPRVTME